MTFHAYLCYTFAAYYEAGLLYSEQKVLHLCLWTQLLGDVDFSLDLISTRTCM